MIGIQAPSSFLLPGFALELLMSESTDCTVPKGGSGRVSWIQAIVEVSTKRNPQTRTGLSNHVKGGEIENSTCTRPGKALYRGYLCFHFGYRSFETKVPKELEFPQESHAGKRKRLKPGVGQEEGLI